MFYDSSYDDYRTVHHIFNVDKNNEVIEFTDLYPVKFEDIHYFGKEYKSKLKDIWIGL